MSIQKATKAQVATAITTAVLVVQFLVTKFPDVTFQFWTSVAVGVVGIIGTAYGVWRVPNAIKPDANPEDLQAAASRLLDQANAVPAGK